MAGQIEIDIDEKGNVTVGVKGVPGKACKDITANIEAAFGKVAKTEETREMNSPAVNKRTVGQK